MTTGAWAADMQAASWRGITFQVAATNVRRGRRIAVHEYPFRDSVWVEDLGRGKREIAFSGFLFGDDVVAQQRRFAAACELAGPGDLVHPALGKMRVAVTNFETTQRADAGRVIELSLSFIETADAPAYPDGASSTQSALGAAVARGFSDVLADFGITAPDLGFGLPTVSAISGEVTRIAGLVSGYVRDPAGSLLSLAGLGGSADYGRSALGDAAGALGAVSRLAGEIGGVLRGGSGGLSSIGGLGSLIGAGRGLFGSVASAAAAFLGSGLFGGGSGQAVASARAASLARRVASDAASAAAIAAARRASAADTASAAAAVAVMVSAARLVPPTAPAQVALLGRIVSAAAAPPAVSAAGLGARISAVQAQTLALVRRAAVLEMAAAVVDYVPPSYDAAAALRASVCAALDAEILAAGDTGADRSYEALRAVRAAVSADLGARGGSLARMVDVSRARSLPALVLAYQLYGDAGRADDLVADADPVAPAFMPLEFRARGR